MKRVIAPPRFMRAAVPVGAVLGLLAALGMLGSARASASTSAWQRPRSATELSDGSSSIKDLPVLALPSSQAASASSDSLPGTLAGAAGSLLNPVTAGTGVLAGLGLEAIDSSVLSAAAAALSAAARAINETTSPQLQSTWFSSTYWRVAALGALLTLPFLFAAAAQALVRSDLGLLVRAAFGYLPLALLGVSLAAPLTMLLLAATDQLCGVVSPAGSSAGAHFLASAALASTEVSTLYGSDFLALIVGLLAVAAAIALLLEMLIREAAVYVVVLMLPLALAAFVWPARRGLAIRMLELLVALILSKFVVVAVLALGGAAYGNGSDDPSRLLTAMALVILSTFAPWVMLRLIPFTEIAAGASSAIHSELPRIARNTMAAGGYAGGAAEWLPSLTARMREHAQDAGQTGARTPRQSALPAGIADLADSPGEAASGQDPSRAPEGRLDELATSARSAVGVPAGAGQTADAAPAAGLGSPSDAGAGLGPRSDAGSGLEPQGAAGDAASSARAAGSPAGSPAEPLSVAGAAEPGAPPTRRRSGIEAVVPGYDTTVPFRLGGDDWTPPLRPAADAPQAEAEPHDQLARPQRDEDGLL